MGEAAEGSIEPSERLERLDEFTDRVGSDEFHVATDITISCDCVDGRHGAGARPNAAGGTLSMGVADDLLRQEYAGDGTTKDMVQNVFRSLKERGFAVGDHTAVEIHGEGASGCGASDNIAKIYDIMRRKGDVIRNIAELFKVDVRDDDHVAIMEAATRRTDFSTGREVLDVMRVVALN